MNKIKLVQLLICLLLPNLLIAKNSEHDRLAREFYNEVAVILKAHQNQKFYKGRIKLFRKSYSPEGYYAYLKLIDSLNILEKRDHLSIDIIKQELAVNDLKAIAQWQKTSVGKKVYQLERLNIPKSADLSFYTERKIYSGKENEWERKRLFLDMEEVFRMTEVIAEIVESRSRFLEQILFSEKNRAIVRKRETGVRKEFHREYIYNQQIKRREFALSNCSNDELKQYIQFLKSESGRKMVKTIRRVIIAHGFSKQIPIPIKQDELPLIAKKMNAQLPKMTGSLIRLNYSKVEGSSLVYNYTVLNPFDEPVNMTELKKRLRTSLEEKICRQVAMAYFPASGITLQHRYFDSKKQQLLDITITPSVCGL